MAKLWRALPALLLLFAAAAAHAEERIHHFWSDVQVQKDSSIEITETIDVQAERSQINHGIYRDFPTRYRGRHGGYMRVGFTFEGATLDGAEVPAKTESIANGVRIKVGDPDKYVDIGEHRYVIRYQTTRQIGRFKDYDELYWNATGNGWMFPIDVAEARIRLPEPVKFGQRAAYTGPQGSTASNAEVVDEKPGDITFRTTQPLGPYEGLTVAVAFPKGVVADLSEGARAGNWLADYGPPIVGFLGLARPVRLLLHCVAACRARSPRRDRGPDFRPARRPLASRHALHLQDESRQSRLCRGLGRHGRSRPRQAGRGGRRLVFAQQDAARAAGWSRPASAGGTGRAQQRSACPASRS